MKLPVVRREEFTKDSSPVELPTHPFGSQRHWFRTEEARRAFLDHRNRMSRARNAGVDPSDVPRYEAYCAWERRGETGRYLDEPQVKLNEIRELLDSGGLSNQEFIMKVIEIVEREES